jgi:hypothetical protein
MLPPHRPHLTPRDRVVVLGAALISVLVAAPGVHVFERWLSPRAAFIVSHGLALLGLGLTAWQWRVRRSRVARSTSPAV